ncbi:MAG: hypothetical protein WBL05_05480 [Brooklawnia sp.]|uniref:hypothetical protein n=1 Tax=Brooklawnia sp. TaxID=2699740 RepID=UPI003C78E632
MPPQHRGAPRLNAGRLAAPDCLAGGLVPDEERPAKPQLEQSRNQFGDGGALVDVQQVAAGQLAAPHQHHRLLARQSGDEFVGRGRLADHQPVGAVRQRFHRVVHIARPADLVTGQHHPGNPDVIPGVGARR